MMKENKESIDKNIDRGINNSINQGYAARDSSVCKTRVNLYMIKGVRWIMVSLLILVCGGLFLTMTKAGYPNYAYQIFTRISGQFQEILNVRDQKIIVLDAGHGGFDSGKVGVSGSLEKEINLQIALKCKKNLEQSGYKVLMTRQDDNGLYEATSNNKKRDDMNRRVEMMNASDVSLAVSIHQNSYTGADCSGAQVFYYKTSEEGKKLAGYIQESLITRVQPQNTRQIKSNSDYFILKYSRVPTVIVECGFLSNVSEEAQLCDEIYQEKIAWAITMGILQYTQIQIDLKE